MDPHTTQKKARTCRDCHQDPRALGLGQGSLHRTERGWTFTPSLSARPELLGIDHALDSYVDVNGTALVRTSRPYLRPMDRTEINRVLDVGACLDCHRDFNDPVMRSWRHGAPPTPCPQGAAALRGEAPPKRSPPLGNPGPKG